MSPYSECIPSLIFMLYFPHAAPSATPVELKCVTSLDSGSEVTITWGPPPADMVNGIIQDYTVTFQPFNLSEEATEMTVSDNLTSLTITNLTSMTPYTVTVQAVTVAPGPPATITCLTGNHNLGECLMKAFFYVLWRA